MFLQITGFLLISLIPFKVAFSEQVSNQCQKSRLPCHDKLCNECHVVFSPSQVTDCPKGCHWILPLAMCKQGQTIWTPMFDTRQIIKLIITLTHILKIALGNTVFGVRRKPVCCMTSFLNFLSIRYSVLYEMENWIY